MLFGLWILLTGAAHAGRPPGPEAAAAFEGNLRSGYAFASFTSPSFESKVTPVARLTTSYLYYLYQGPSHEVHVRSPGLGLAFGVRWRPERLLLTAVAGYEARYTMEFDPDERQVSHTDHGVALSGDAYVQATSRFAVALTGYYGFAQDYLWGRALAKHRVYPWDGSSIAVLALGLDATARGNDITRGLDVGFLAEITAPAHEVSFGARVGLGRELQPGSDPALAPSIGASIYKSF